MVIYNAITGLQTVKGLQPINLRTCHWSPCSSETRRCASEDEATTLSHSMGCQLHSDATPHHKRTQTQTVTLRKPKNLQPITGFTFLRFLLYVYYHALNVYSEALFRHEWRQVVQELLSRRIEKIQTTAVCYACKGIRDGEITGKVKEMLERKLSPKRTFRLCDQ